VAARARTGKQVLYRRWRNRAELVIAAMRHHSGTIAERVPDTGTLREDALTVLRLMSERQREVGQDVIHGLLAEAGLRKTEAAETMQGIMRTLLERAAERGEIPTADVPTRLLTLPADLLRHEMVLGDEPVGERTLEEIVDVVFLPLVGERPAPGL
jgi:AcrR family transcriptional regulator